MIWQSRAIRYVSCQPNMQITFLENLKKVYFFTTYFDDYVNGIEQQFGGCILQNHKMKQKNKVLPLSILLTSSLPTSSCIQRPNHTQSKTVWRE